MLKVLNGWIAGVVIRSNIQEGNALQIQRSEEYFIVSDLWVPMKAALGSSALTGLVAFGLEWWRSKRADKSAQAERRSRAYSMLLTRSTIIVHLASDLHTAMELRPGLAEGLNVTIGIQKKLDPLELTDRLHSELKPLYKAWSELRVVGSKEVIPEANDLVARCGKEKQGLCY